VIRRIASGLASRARDRNGAICMLVESSDVQRIRARIDAHFKTGATHVSIQALHVDGEAGPDVRAVEALAPAP